MKYFKNCNILKNNEIKNCTIVTEGSYIVDILNNDEALDKITETDQVIDLENNFVLPSFINLSSNFFSLCQYYMVCDLDNKTNPDKILKFIKEYDTNFKPVNVLIAIGLESKIIKDNLITQKQLDNLFINKPIIISGRDNDIWLVNSLLQKQLLEKENDLKIENGVFDQSVFNKIINHIPNKSIEDIVNSINYVQNKLLEKGITTIEFSLHNKSELDVLLSMATNKTIKLDMIIHLDYLEFKELYKVLKEKLYGYTNHLRIGGLVYNIDNSLYSSNFSDLELSTPINEKQVINDISELIKMDTQVIFNCDKRKSLNEFLSILFKIENNNELLSTIKKNKWIIKNEFASLEDLKKIKIMGLSLINSPSIVWNFGHVIEANESSTNSLLPIKSIINEKIELGFSNDLLFNGLNIFESFWSYTNRKSKSLKTINDKEIITINDVNNIMFNNSYDLMFETRKSKIEKGFYADMVVVDKNILTEEKEHLSSVKILKTFFRSNEVYNKK